MLRRAAALAQSHPQLGKDLGRRELVPIVQVAGVVVGPANSVSKVT